MHSTKVVHAYLIHPLDVCFQDNKSLQQLVGDDPCLEAMDSLPRLELCWKTADVDFVHKFYNAGEEVELKAKVKIPYLTTKEEWSKVPENTRMVPVRPASPLQVTAQNEKLAKVKAKAKEKADQKKADQGTGTSGTGSGSSNKPIVNWKKVCPHLDR